MENTSEHNVFYQHRNQTVLNKAFVLTKHFQFLVTYVFFFLMFKLLHAFALHDCQFSQYKVKHYHSQQHTRHCCNFKNGQILCIQALVHRWSSVGKFISHCLSFLLHVRAHSSSTWQAALSSLSEEHWGFQECQSCHRAMLPAAAVIELLVTEATLGMSGLRALSLRTVGRGQHVMREGGIGIRGSKPNAKIDLLVCKKIPHFIPSY